MRRELNLAPDDLRRVVRVRDHLKDPPLHQDLQVVVGPVVQALAVDPVFDDVDRVLD